MSFSLYPICVWCLRLVQTLPFFSLSVVEQYINLLYYTSVVAGGFPLGDIVPITTKEKTWAVLQLLVGARRPACQGR
jgi:hypothetical protein